MKRLVRFVSAKCALYFGMSVALLVFAYRSELNIFIATVIGIAVWFMSAAIFGVADSVITAREKEGEP